jgi:hypothetical protein
LSKNPYTFFENYVLRTPVLSINNYFDLTESNKISDDDLINQWENQLLKEALFLASPYLHEELENYFSGRIDCPKKKELLKISFLKYVVRASSRCTPFGLFAGISLGKLSNGNKIELEKITNFKRFTRLDMNYLIELGNWLSNVPVIKNKLVFYPNNTLYKIANQFRYIEHNTEFGKRNYTIEAFDYSPYIQKVLDIAKEGNTIKDLAVSLVDDIISLDEATEFINDLIKNQILISELEPTIVGEDMLNNLLNVLTKVQNAESYSSLLIDLKSNVESLDDKIVNSKQAYLKIIQHIKTINIPFDIKYVFQTDLFLDTKYNNINKNHALQLQKAFSLLSKFKSHGENENLTRFKNAFVNRYESREMPLSHVLDIETGIGYIQKNDISDTVPFLSDISTFTKASLAKPFFLSRIDKILQIKINKALLAKQKSIELFDNDFSHIDDQLNNLPDTFSIITEVIDLDGEEYIFLGGTGGSSGANILSRFCYGDKKILNHVKKITNIEKQINKEYILAEIIHIPEARIGNILRRPHLMEFEFPYLGSSTLSKSQQILIDDITVYIENEKIILKSKKHGKQIIPRLSSTHNFHINSLPLYHFLCDLQTQDQNGKIGFFLGEIFSIQPFLPRIKYKNIILSKAKWNIEVEELNFIISLYTKEDEMLKQITAWRTLNNIPQYVQLVEHDNTLLINLKNSTMIKVLLNSIKNQKRFTLEEFLFTGNTVVKRNDKMFTNQIIFSFYNNCKTFL